MVTYAKFSSGLLAVEVSEFQELLNTLSKRAPVITGTQLDEVLADKACHVVIAMNEARKIVGMATITIINILSGKKGYIDDVVMLEEYQGRGIGKELTLRLIEIGKNEGVKFIDLSTNPSRLAANALYQKLGFVKRDTNVYRLSVIAIEPSTALPVLENEKKLPSP